MRLPPPVAKPFGRLRRPASQAGFFVSGSAPHVSKDALQTCGEGELGWRRWKEFATAIACSQPSTGTKSKRASEWRQCPPETRAAALHIPVQYAACRVVGSPYLVVVGAVGATGARATGGATGAA